MQSFADLFDAYRHAYVAAALLAVGCAVVGVHVVLRRVAFVGIATAQVAAAGTALAFLVHVPPLVGAVVATSFGLGLFATGRVSPRLTRDGLVGAAFALASALAVLFVSRSGAELDQVEHIVYGTLLFTTGDQVARLAVGVAGVLSLHAAFGREFFMVSFDSESARTLGVRTRLFEMLFYLSFGVIIALAIGTAGSLLAFAFLILPPLCALLLCDRLVTVVLMSASTALLMALLGVMNSVVFDAPTGPAVVVTAAAVLPCAAAARWSRWAGTLLLAALLGVTAWGALDRFSPTEEVTDSAVAEVHLDLELAVHGPSVRRGEPLEIDYVVRATGPVPPNLHLLVEWGGEMQVAPLPGLRSGRSGRVTFDTTAVAPGSYPVSGSFWTGPPLDPDDETELLPPGACTAHELSAELLP